MFVQRGESMQIIDANETIASLGMTCLNELSTFGALSNGFIVSLLHNGVIRRYKKGEYITRSEQIAEDFQVLLSGRMAYYRRFEGRDVLTREFHQGEQMGFDQMIGLLVQNGTDVAVEDSVVLDISSQQFFRLHVEFPADFGLFMINLARELAREIEILENVIGSGTGWQENE
jgi:signal-transduction protein with cAMP-binding, CBS, and nucleotidyltransferase domain